MNKLLDYKDITLIPTELSTIGSRDDIDISVEFCGRRLTVPLIASPMKDCCNGHVAKVIRDNGGFGIIHRFQTIEQQVLDFLEAGDAGCAIGIQNEDMNRISALYRVGCRVFCIDVANGLHQRVTSFITDIANKYKDVYLIVGNVASIEGFSALEWWPEVYGVRCGVAGGEACSTKHATGIYSPAVSLLEGCRVHKDKTFNSKTSIIADGGIKEPSDFCKAMMFADVVMVGSLIANTSESPAEIISRDGRNYTVFSGSASFETQKIYKDKPKYIEGRTKELEYTGQTIKDVIENFTQGLRSSMSYFNAKNLQEYRKNKNYGVIS